MRIEGRIFFANASHVEDVVWHLVGGERPRVVVLDCRAVIDRYFANGVTTSSVTVLPLDPALDGWSALRSLSPSAG